MVKYEYMFSTRHPRLYNSNNGSIVPSEYPSNDPSTELYNREKSAELYKRVQHIHEKESVMFMHQQQPQTESPVKGPLFGVKRNRKKEGNPAPAPRPNSWHNPGILTSKQNSDPQKRQESIVQEHKPVAFFRDDEKPKMYSRRSSGTFTQKQEKNQMFTSTRSCSNLNSNIYESENHQPTNKRGMVKMYASQIDMHVTTKPNYSGTGQDYVKLENLTTGPIHYGYNHKLRSNIEPADVYPQKVVSKQISRDKSLAFVGTIPDKTSVKRSSYNPHVQDYCIHKSPVYSNNNFSSGTVQMPVRQMAVGVDPHEFQKQKTQKDIQTPVYKQDKVYVQSKSVVNVDKNPPPPPIRDESSLPTSIVIHDHVKSSSWPVHTVPNMQTNSNATTQKNTITSDSLPPVKLQREPVTRESAFTNEQEKNVQNNARTSKISPKIETKKDPHSGLFTATFCEVMTEESGLSDKEYTYGKDTNKPYDYNSYDVPSPPTRDTDVEPWRANQNNRHHTSLDVLPKPTSTLSSENLVGTYKSYLEQSLQNEEYSPERMDKTYVHEPKVHINYKTGEKTYPVIKRTFSSTSELSHSRKTSDIVSSVSPTYLQKQSIMENESTRSQRLSASLDETVPGRYWKSPDDHTKEENWKHLVETADAQYQKINGNSKQVQEEANPPMPSRIRSPISSQGYDEDFEQTLRGRSDSDVFVDDPPLNNFGLATEDYSKMNLYRQQHIESNNLNNTAPAGDSNFSNSDLKKLPSSSFLSKLQRDQMAPYPDKQISDYYSSTKDHNKERSYSDYHSPSSNKRSDTMYQDILSSAGDHNLHRQERYQDNSQAQTNEDYSQKLKAVQQKVLQQMSNTQPSPRHSDSSSSSSSSSRRSSHSMQYSIDSDNGVQNRFKPSEMYKRSQIDTERINRSRFSDPKKYRKQFDNVKGEHQHSKSDSERHKKPVNNMQGHKKMSDPSGAIPKSQRLSDPQAQAKFHGQDPRHAEFMSKRNTMGSSNSLRSTSSGSRQGSISDQVTSPVGSSHSKSSSLSSRHSSYSHSGHLSSASSTSSLSPSPKPPSPTTVGKLPLFSYGQQTFSYSERSHPDVVASYRPSIGSYNSTNNDRSHKASIRRTHSTSILPTPVKVIPPKQFSDEQHGIESMENYMNTVLQEKHPYRVEETSDWPPANCYQSPPSKPAIIPTDKNETSHTTILEAEEEVPTSAPSPNIISSTSRRDEDSDGSGRSSETPDIIVGTEQKESRSRLNVDKVRYDTTESFILPSPPATPVEMDMPYPDLPPPPPEVLEDKSQTRDMELPPPPSPEEAKIAINRLDSLEGNSPTMQFTEDKNNTLNRSNSEVVGNSHRFHRPSHDGGDFKTSPSITPSLSPASDVSISPSITTEFTNGFSLPTNGHSTHEQEESNINCINRKLSKTSLTEHPQLSSLERWKERRIHETDKRSEELKNIILRSCEDSELIRLLSTEVSAEAYIMEIFPDMSNGCVENHVKDGPSSPDRIPTSPIPALSPTSQYYISTSKALLMKKASQEIEGSSEELDTQELNKKKAELINSISKKLEGLKLELQELEEDKKKNEELGNEVTEVVKKVCERREIRKYNQYIEEQSKIIDLLLSLSGRVARAENALSTAEAEDDEEQKTSLQQLLTKLRQQYEDAKTLKNSVDKKSKTVSTFLKTNLNTEQYQDYEYFIKTKSNLTWMSREFNDKIKLGEEQLQALRGSMLSSDKAL
ncbi:uncharacterized protein [Antedon mediterranea]|uniref:uncharacterized protein isoform X2 n=1 Tax=Antedon mediterranea TaxID=105859 RepID=UPI003AF53BD5